VGVFYNSVTDRERADSNSEERDNWVQMDWDNFFRSLRSPGFTAEDCKREALQYNRTHPPRPAHRDIDPDLRGRKQLKNSKLR